MLALPSRSTRMSSDAVRIAPYWSRFGEFLRYPLRLEALAACLAAGVFSVALEFFFSPLKLLMQVLLWVAVLRYAFSVLERTAYGYLDDRFMLFESLHGGRHLPYKHFVAIVAGVVAGVLAAMLGGPHFGGLVGVLLGVCWPASIMVLAITNNLGWSLSPLRLWAVMHAIGMPYLGLVACLLLITSASGGLISLLEPVLPAWPLWMAGGAAAAYFTLVMFRMMGYVIYQYHEPLGLQPRVTAVAEEAPQDAARHIAALLREGRNPEALALARAEVAEQPASREANLRLHRLLLAMPDEAEALLAHARAWLPGLIANDRSGLALEVIEALWRSAPDFRPQQGAEALALAQLAYERRRFDTAARLLKGFDRHYPGHRDTAAAYLLAVRLLIEQRHDYDQAERLLAGLKRRFPDQLREEVARQEALLARLRAVSRVPERTGV